MSAGEPEAASGLGRDSGRTMIGTAATTVCNFALIAVVGRALGNDGLGTYSIAFALRAVLVLVAGMGMRIALTKFVASLRARGDDAAVRAVVRLGIWLPLALSLVLALALAATAEPLADDVFASDELAFMLQMVALSLPFAVLLDTSLAATQGFLSMRAYARIGLILEPALRLALTGVALALGSGVHGCAAALAAAGVVAGLVAALALSRDLRRLDPVGRSSAQGLVRFAGVSWVASLATQGLLWADILILGMLVTDEEVGVYQVATRIVLAATVMVTPLTAAMAPRVAHAHAVGDRASLSSRYDSIVLWSWRLTLPLLAGVLVVPHAALAAFGDDFGDGIDIIRVLACAAVVEALAAPSAVLLNQIGRNRLNMAINVAALATNITLNFVLVPRIGILGAAVAWAVVMIVPGIVRVVAVRRLATDQWPFGRSHAAALAGAVIAGGAASATTSTVPDVWSVQLLVAAVTMLVVYVLVVWLLGLTEQERSALGVRIHIAREVLLTRVPFVRRMRNRWRVRALEAGSAGIPIDELISPWRYDILARVELFRMIRDHPVAPERDFARFMERANASRYRLWFDQVLVGVLRLEHTSAGARDRVFEQVVARSLQLFRSVERHGFDPRHPVTVARVPAGVAVGGRALAEDRWIPMDGCHRLALMYLDGKRTLESDAYAVDPLDVRRYHTERMARAERLGVEDLARFFAAGLAEESWPESVHTWEDLLQHLRNPANRAALEQWPEAAWLRAGSRPDWLEAEELDQSPPIGG